MKNANSYFSSHFFISIHLKMICNNQRKSGQSASLALPTKAGLRSTSLETQPYAFLKTP